MQKILMFYSHVRRSKSATIAVCAVGSKLSQSNKEGSEFVVSLTLSVLGEEVTNRTQNTYIICYVSCQCQHTKTRCERTRCDRTTELGIEEARSRKHENRQSEKDIGRAQ